MGKPGSSQRPPRSSNTKKWASLLRTALDFYVGILQTGFSFFTASRGDHKILSSMRVYPVQGCKHTGLQGCNTWLGGQEACTWVSACRRTKGERTGEQGAHHPCRAEAQAGPQHVCCAQALLRLLEVAGGGRGHARREADRARAGAARGGRERKRPGAEEGRDADVEDHVLQARALAVVRVRDAGS